MTLKNVNWFRVATILALGLGVIWLLIILGRSPLGLLIPSASADTAELTWVAPTHNCNGTSLTNLAGYDLLYGQKRQTLPLTPLTYTVTGLPPGVWWFSLAAVNSAGERSEFVTVEKTILPEGFKTIGTTVYTFVRADGKILLLPTLHTVPVGTVCDATQSVNGKYLVPREAVRWSGNARLVAALADCG